MERMHTIGYVKKVFTFSREMLMKKLVVCLVMGFLCSAVFAADEIKLPAPKKSGGMPVLEAIDNRGSATGSEFPKGGISDADLSTILWAASGHNRDGKLWTVPMAMGREPYCKVYVLRKDGAYLFDWRNHSLRKVSGDDLTKTVPMQPFAQHAPVTLVIASDGKEVADMSGQFAGEFAVVLAGAMSQNIYLAAESVNVGARLVYSIKRDVASKSLKLAETDTPFFGIILGGK